MSAFAQRSACAADTAASRLKALEFGEAEEMEDEPAARGGRVEVVVPEAAEPDVSGVQAGDDGEEADEGPGEAVELPHDEGVALPRQDLGANPLGGGSALETVTGGSQTFNLDRTSRREPKGEIGRTSTNRR